jgi:integrase/recombinase XerC
LPVSNPLVQRYLDHVRFEKRLAERTLSLYQQHLRQLIDFAGDLSRDWPQIQPAHIRRWAAQWHAGTGLAVAAHSGRSVALMLSAWRGFFDWLCREGLLSSNPVQAVRAPKSAKLLPKALRVDDAVQLAEFKAAELGPLSRWLEARDAAMVELLYGCGIRVGELVGLDCAFSSEADRGGRGWLDLGNAEIQVFGKGRKRRQLPLGRQALAAVKAWLQVRSTGLVAGIECPALFMGQRGARLTPQAVWQRLRQRSVQAGLTAPVHPHMLRHSFASHVLQSSGDLRAVQELMGHASISSTQVYTGLDFQHLAKVYDAAHPRAHKKT